jgi:hypothetical protein
MAAMTFSRTFKKIIGSEERELTLTIGKLKEGFLLGIQDKSPADMIEFKVVLKSKGLKATFREKNERSDTHNLLTVTIKIAEKAKGLLLSAIGEGEDAGKLKFVLKPFGFLITFRQTIKGDNYLQKIKGLPKGFTFLITQEEKVNNEPLKVVALCELLESDS